MAKKSRKLSLRSETVRRLDALTDGDLARVAGGTVIYTSYIVFPTLNCDGMGRLGGSMTCDTRCM